MADIPKELAFRKVKKPNMPVKKYIDPSFVDRRPTVDRSKPKRDNSLTRKQYEVLEFIEKWGMRGIVMTEVGLRVFGEYSQSSYGAIRCAKQSCSALIRRGFIEFSKLNDKGNRVVLTKRGKDYIKYIAIPSTSNDD